MQRLFVLACVLTAAASPASAQRVLAPPPGIGGACLVEGLNPRGDGFLAVRSGPGSQHRQLGELFNGDEAILAGGCRGSWCYAQATYRDGQPVGLAGWIHTRWCTPLAE